jgi:toxin FitB
VSYLLDTNVLTELARVQPNDRVVRWFGEIPSDALHMSVLSLGEIRRGIERLAASPRRERLRVWLESELRDWFEDRVLTIDAGVADRWGRLLAESRRPIPAVDGLLAATALHHELRFVTRNTADFDVAGLDVVDPWSA